MNTLEKLGYVKQPQDEEDCLQEYIKGEPPTDKWSFVEVIYVRPTCAKKMARLKEGMEVSDFIEKEEMQAVLELMEGK